MIFTFTSPKCHFSFTPSSLFWSPPSHLHIYPSFFIVHYSLLKCWRCLRGSCIISPSVWSASDIHEEEKQGDSTYSATKCPSSSPTFEWHQDSEEFDSSGMLTAKWLLARPSLAVFRGNSGEGGGTLNGQDKLKSQPAILLFRSVDAIKQENGAWRPLHDYSADFTWFSPGPECKSFWHNMPCLDQVWDL